MPRRLSDLHRAAFVTGASSGLGRAFAEMLLAEGVNVWGTSRDPARLAGLGPGQPGVFHPAVLDLAAPAEAEAVFRRAAAEAGGAFDLVINNAGYGVFGGINAVEASVWQAQLDAMLGATLRLSRTAVRDMEARGRGCLVNVSSLAAEFPLPFMSGYNVAKAGLSALSQSLAFEFRGTGVAVIDFRPGDYRTAFNRAMAPAEGGLGTRAAAAWSRLESHLASSPPPEKAAADLRRALLRRRRGLVRSGSVFQAAITPFFARLVPTSALQAVIARYYGCS